MAGTQYLDCQCGAIYSAQSIGHGPTRDVRITSGGKEHRVCPICQADLKTAWWQKELAAWTAGQLSKRKKEE